MAKTTPAETLSAYKRIMKDLEKGVYKPCYLLMGEEPYYVDQITSYIAAHALTEDEKAWAAIYEVI